MSYEIMVTAVSKPVDEMEMNQSNTPVKSDDVILLLGRVALGAIFVKSGIQKLLALSVFAASLAQRGFRQSEMWAVIGVTVDFVGGILIITGFQTRYASLLMVLFVIVAMGKPIRQRPGPFRRLSRASRLNRGVDE